MTRQEAMEKGLKKYSPDTPCIRGHLAPRYTSTGNCTACHRLREQRPSISGIVRLDCHVPVDALEDFRALLRLFGGLEVLHPIVREVLIPVDLTGDFQAALKQLIRMHPASTPGPGDSGTVPWERNP